MVNWSGAAWLTAICLASPWLQASAEDHIRWDLYHKSDAILDFFKKTALKLPTRVRYENLPDPDTDTSLPVVTITDFATGEAGKEVILLLGGEHGRELITSEIVFWLGKLLSGVDEELASWPAIERATAAAWQRGWAKGTLKEWADDLLKRVLFKIIPIENIQGRKAVEAGDLCMRKTAAGVDLNRNWEYAWTAAEEGGEEYGGPRPFSEPETRIVRLIGQATRPQAFVNLHSGEYAVYVPWDSQAGLAPGLPADIGEVLEKLDAYCQCMHGPAGEVAGYLAFGSSMDYMHQELHVAYPLTIEVYGPQGLGKTAMGGHPRRRRLRQAAAGKVLPNLAPDGQALPDLATGGAEEGGGDARRAQLLQSTALLGRFGSAPLKPGHATQTEPGLSISGVRAAGNASSTAVPGGGDGGSSSLAAALSSGLGGAAAGEEGTVPEDVAARCLADYNPLEREDYQEVVATWLASLLVLAGHLAEHPAASAAAADAEQGQLPLPPTPPSKQDLAATGRLGEEQEPSDFSQMAAGAVQAKKKGSLPWLPTSMALPETFQHQVQQATPTNATQAVLLGVIVASLILALLALWGKLGRPVPWGNVGSPARRRSLTRHRAGRHNV